MLTPKVELLIILAGAYSKTDQLLEQVWEYDYPGTGC